MTRPARTHNRQMFPREVCDIDPEYGWKTPRYFPGQMIAVTADTDRVRLLAELAPGIFHDIRNMLNIILNRTHLARHQGQANIGETLELIETAARSASRLIDIPMQVAGLRSRAAAPHSNLNLNVRLVAMLPVLERILPGVTLRLCLATSNLWNVKANAAEFDAAILNLAMNARDALQACGRADATITIRTANVSDRIGCHQAEDRVLVSVADNGPGMDACTLSRAWEPYFTTKGEHGTGLGLDQVRRFAESMSGRARIRSTTGRGTIVHLLLPRAIPGDGLSRHTTAEYRREVHHSIRPEGSTVEPAEEQRP